MAPCYISPPDKNSWKDKGGGGGGGGGTGEMDARLKN